MGSCLEVAVVTIFTKHCYKFCEDIYLQQGGGPTGLSSTGSSADVRVTAWARELLRILTDNNVNLEMLFAYVDDIRLVLKALIEGLMFCGKCKTLYHNVDQEKRDLESGETDTQRTSRVLKDIFNSIESDLRFTVESEDDFDDKMLPTLDTKLCMTQESITSAGHPATTPPHPHLQPHQPNHGGTQSTWVRGWGWAILVTPGPSRVPPNNSSPYPPHP